MDKNVIFTAPQPCQRALPSARVLTTTWRRDLAAQGALRLRDERGVALACAAKAAKAPKAAELAANAAHVTGPVAWRPPPC